MGTATLTKPKTIKIMSRYASHQIKLEDYEEVIDAHHGKRQVPGTGKMIRFTNYLADISEDWWPLLENHSDRLVQNGVVGIADQWTGMPTHSAGPQIVTGAYATRTASTNTAPHQGWDEATTKQIEGWLAARQIANPEQAFAYEMANRRRKMVVRAITEAMLGDTPEPEAAPEPEPLAASYSAPIPSADDI